MKVYIVSEDRKIGINIANLVNGSGNSGIISEKEHEGYREMAQDLKENKKSFDVAFVVASKPIAVSAHANKLGGLRAVVCRDSKEVAEAMEEESNVIVLNSSRYKEAEFMDMLETVTGAEITPQGGAQESLMNVGKATFKLFERKPKAEKEEAPEKEEAEEEKEEPEERERKPSGSVAKRLKDSLGIKD